MYRAGRAAPRRAAPRRAAPVPYPICLQHAGCTMPRRAAPSTPMWTMAPMIQPEWQTQVLYNGLIDCAVKTVAREGVKGLFVGMISPLVAQARRLYGPPYCLICGRALVETRWVVHGLTWDGLQVIIRWPGRT